MKIHSENSLSRGENYKSLRIVEQHEPYGKSILLIDCTGHAGGANSIVVVLVCLLVTSIAFPFQRENCAGHADAASNGIAGAVHLRNSFSSFFTRSTKGENSD